MAIYSCCYHHVIYCSSKSLFALQFLETDVRRGSVSVTLELSEQKIIKSVSSLPLLFLPPLLATFLPLHLLFINLYGPEFLVFFLKRNSTF